MGAARAAAEGRISSISAAVLAGGDAARVRWLLAGLSPAAHLVGLLEELFDDVFAVGGGADPTRRLADGDGPARALRALVVALEEAREPHVLVVGAEIPLVPAELLLALVASPSAPVVAPSETAAPSCALLDRAVLLPPARLRLAAGRFEVAELFEELGVTALPPEALARLDPHGLLQLRVDTPEGRARAEAWHRALAASGSPREGV